MAVNQLNFIAGAEQLPAMGLLELTFKSVGSVAIYTSVWLAITLMQLDSRAVVQFDIPVIVPTQDRLSLKFDPIPTFRFRIKFG